MNRLVAALCLLAAAGCVAEPEGARRPTTDRQLTDIRPTSPPEVPAVNPPIEGRQRNYSGGSCVFASTCTASRWMGRDDIAQAMRASCHGGSGQSRLHENLKRMGAPFVFTSTGSVAFLEWASRTRRGAMIFYYPNHAVTFVGFSSTHAFLIDNNRIDRAISIERNTFIRNWKSWGGAATVPLVGPPAPPL